MTAARSSQTATSTTRGQPTVKSSSVLRAEKKSHDQRSVPTQSSKATHSGAPTTGAGVKHQSTSASGRTAKTSKPGPPTDTRPPYTSSNVKSTPTRTTSTRGSRSTSSSSLRGVSRPSTSSDSSPGGSTTSLSSSGSRRAAGGKPQQSAHQASVHTPTTGSALAHASTVSQSTPIPSPVLSTAPGAFSTHSSWPMMSGSTLDPGTVPDTNSVTSNPSHTSSSDRFNMSWSFQPPVTLDTQTTLPSQAGVPQPDYKSQPSTTASIVGRTTTTSTTTGTYPSKTVETAPLHSDHEKRHPEYDWKDQPAQVTTTYTETVLSEQGGGSQGSTGYGNQRKSTSAHTKHTTTTSYTSSYTTKTTTTPTRTTPSTVAMEKARGHVSTTPVTHKDAGSPGIHGGSKPSSIYRDRESPSVKKEHETSISKQQRLPSSDASDQLAGTAHYIGHHSSPSDRVSGLGSVQISQPLPATTTTVGSFVNREKPVTTTTAGGGVHGGHTPTASDKYADGSVNTSVLLIKELYKNTSANEARFLEYKQHRVKQGAKVMLEEQVRSSKKKLQESKRKATEGTRTAPDGLSKEGATAAKNLRRKINDTKKQHTALQER